MLCSSGLLLRLFQCAPQARAALLPLLAAYVPEEAFRRKFRGVRSLHIFARRPNANHTKVQVHDGADAGDLKDAVCAKLKLDAPPDSVSLLREVEGGGAPVPLDSCKGLAEQGVCEGTRVVVEMLDAPTHAQQQLAQEQQLARLDHAVATLAALAGAAAAPPVSASQLGHTFSESLTMQGKLGQEPALAGAAPVLSAAQVAQLCQMRGAQGEAAVVAFMTPIIAQYVREVWGAAGAAATSSAPVLVNSEVFPWLLPPAAPHLFSLRYKPDLYLTWAPFAELRQGGGLKGQGQGEGYLFGPLAGGGALQREGCVSVVFEGKVGGLTPSHFGELASYHQALPGQAWGVLFGSQHFWMYTSFNGLPLALRKDAWAAGGSAARLRSFLAEAAAQPPPPLLQLLRRLMADLCLEPLHLPRAPGSGGGGTASTCCHLGSGASGHVFAARSSSSSSGASGASPPRALKVVLAPRGDRGGQHKPSFATTAYTDLAKEFQVLRRLAHLGAPVVPPLPDSLRIYEGGSGGMRGGGYAMACVCTPVAAVDSLQRCGGVFAALAALHAHGVAHGDARLANLMVLPAAEGAPPGGLAWIDMRTAVSERGGEEGPLELPLLQRADALALTRSVLGVGAEGALPARVEAAAQRWEAGCAHAVAALAEAVWEAAAAATARGR